MLQLQRMSERGLMRGRSAVYEGLSYPGLGRVRDRGLPPLMLPILLLLRLRGWSARRRRPLRSVLQAIYMWWFRESDRLHYVLGLGYWSRGGLGVVLLLGQHIEVVWRVRR